VIVPTNESKSNGKAPEKYGEVVQRLEEVVKKLELGDLPLEESLKAFEEGIRLVRRGEQLLNDAEKRIEQLLIDGGGDRVVALNLPPSPGGSGAERSTASDKPPTQRLSNDMDDDDIPF
jgi:exodeoxyribonuclease VII small subunit